MTTIVGENVNEFEDLIKVSWSRKFITAVHKINKKRFDDHRVFLANRISTFEGDHYLVEVNSVVSKIAKRNIEKVCNSIIEHVTDVSGGNIQITWMTLYFKVVTSGELWLQFCSRVKVRDYVSFQN